MMCSSYGCLNAAGSDGLCRQHKANPVPIPSFDDTPLTAHEKVLLSAVSDKDMVIDERLRSGEEAGGLKPCGTAAAYKRHKRRGETPCAACVAAKREEDRESRRRHRVLRLELSETLDDSDSGYEDEDIIASLARNTA